MNPAEIKVVPVCACSICCFLTFFAIIALPLSFKSLDQGKYALSLSWSTQKIADEVYTEPGMYMVGLGNMLVEYPSTFQTMYFVAGDAGQASADADVANPSIRRPPLRARSSDGLEMIVSASFQWQLSKDSLKPLYDILGGSTLEQSLYRDGFVRIARAAIVKSCTKFAAELFFTHREAITADMKTTVQEAFNRPDLGLLITITGLQLQEVDLPDAFDAEIVRTQEQMQELEVAQAERAEQRIIMERRLLVAELNVDRVIQEALGNAERTLINNEAYVKQLLFFQERQAVANSMILKTFWNSTNPWARLFEMMEVYGLNAHEDKRLLISINDDYLQGARADR